MESLQHIVQVLARPIEFASRNGYARVAAVKNLGAFVSTQVIQALSERVFPQAVEAELLTLRQLFADFDAQGQPGERRRRLAEGLVILRHLRRLSGPRPDEPNGAPPTRVTPAATRRGEPRARVRPGPLPPTGPLWTIPIRYAKGVGPKRAVLLEKVGIRTVEDALWFLPWRYEDRSIVTPIGQVSPGIDATVYGTVQATRLKRVLRRNFSILEVTVQDETGGLVAVFFNQPYLEKLLSAGARIMLSGRVSAGRRGWTDLRLDSPQYEVLGGEGEEDEAPLHVGRIVPIYHETKGLTSRLLRVVLKGLLEHYRGALAEVFPDALRRRLQLPTITEAMPAVHFPPGTADRAALDRGTTPAHRRLAFEEFFLLELALALRHQGVKEEIKGIRFDPQTPLLARLRARLPFVLTAAQERVIADIHRDMTSPRPMNRLLQGDVGCGKTVVALHALVLACGSGFQAALMVPTEILAEQHFLTLRDLLTDLGLRTVLLTSGGSVTRRKVALRLIASGEAQVVIGTHALIQKHVQFAKLGLAVVDEQHRFGVLQRKTLVDKGYRPDMLVMTATPIPRTLAMTVYGDLDVSVIDAMPPGRKPVQTLLFAEGQRPRAYQLLLREVRAGWQGYLVYPLIEESEKVDLQAAIQGFERLRVREFRDVRIGLLHGRMKAEEKERIMRGFKTGAIQVLVTTTVIEVGVDVPNATVMMIEHADRFGLAQLHQLRGRVGRGAQDSYCLLLKTGRARRGSLPSSGQTGLPGLSGHASSARRRLDALVRSTDGFVIAEEDLRIRGPGEFFGVRQWGMPEFRAANLIRDADLLEQARSEAFALLAADPALAAEEHHGVRAAMLRRWKAKLDLGTVG